MEAGVASGVFHRILASADDKGIDHVSEWKRRIRLFIQRFWQRPQAQRMTCMPGSWGNIMSLVHWTIAFRTGLLTGAPWPYF